MAAAAEVIELSKKFRGTTVVDQVSFTVETGSVLALLGPNGAGKSTTVSMVCGLLRSDGGHARVLGDDVASDPKKIHSHVGVMFQDTIVYEDLTADENLRLFGGLHGLRGKRLRDRISSVLELVQLTDHRKRRVSTYSGGMKRRLAMAVVLLHEPPMLVLDEPTLGIDVQARNAIWERILTLREDGHAILLCTNYMEEVDRLADHVVILDHGRVVVNEPMEKVRVRAGGVAVRLSMGQVPPSNLLEGLQDMRWETSDQHVVLSFRLPQGAADLPRLLSTIEGHTSILGIEMHEPTMSDVFLAITGRELRD